MQWLAEKPLTSGDPRRAEIVELLARTVVEAAGADLGQVDLGSQRVWVQVDEPAKGWAGSVGGVLTALALAVDAEPGRQAGPSVSSSILSNSPPEVTAATSLLAAAAAGRADCASTTAATH